ncbi:hypothetical protein HDU96_006957 [Phlyctochytrium bullatum]|nr:hypothetical protein HDU96_006957 [Phlyctochytrium bullatum]
MAPSQLTTQPAVESPLATTLDVASAGALATESTAGTQPNPHSHTPSPLLPPSAVKAIQELQQQPTGNDIPRKSSNPAAGIKPLPVAHYNQLSFPNSLLPSYVLNQRNANFEGAKFYKLEIIDCKLEGCSFRDVFIHTLIMEGPKTTLRSCDVMGLIVANLAHSKPQSTSVDTQPTANSTTQASGASASSPGSPTSGTGNLISDAKPANNASIPTTPKSARKLPNASEPTSPSISLSSLAYTGGSAHDLLSSMNSLTSFPDPSEIGQSNPSADSRMSVSTASNSTFSPVMLPNSPPIQPFSPSLDPQTPAMAEDPTPPTAEEREAARAAESAAAAAIEAKQLTPPLPLAELLHLSWKGAYFGSGATELQSLKSKARRAAAAKESAGGSSSGAGASSVTQYGSPSAGNGFGGAHEFLPPSGPSSSSIGSSGVTASVSPVVLQPGWARTMTCLQKIVAGDYK